MTTLVAKPLILMHEALLEPTAARTGCSRSSALAPPLVGAGAAAAPGARLDAAGRRHVRTLLLLGDALYYRFFGDVLSVPAMLAVRQTGQVSGIHPQPADAGDVVARASTSRSRSWLAVMMASRRAAPGRAPAAAVVAAAALLALAARHRSRLARARREPRSIRCSAIGR